MKANDQAPEITIDLNEGLVIEGMKFGDEIFGTIMSAVKVLEPMFTNFVEKAKDRFKKWASDPEDEINGICRHIAKENAGKSFIMGLIKSKEWVDVDEDHKVRKDVYVHYPVSEMGEIGDIVTQAAGRPYWYVKFNADGTFDTVKEDIITASQWAEELGLTYIGKRVAE